LANEAFHKVSINQENIFNARS